MAADEKCDIVVLGAGITGLTTAFTLSKDSSVTVTVVGKHTPGDWDIEYASPYATANFMPGIGHAGWERESWPELYRLAKEVPAAGIHPLEARLLRRDKDVRAPGHNNFWKDLFADNPWYAKVLPDYRELPAALVPAGYDDGRSFTTVCINPQLYVPWMASQCLAQGVVIRRGNVSHVLDARRLSAHTGAAQIVVNATGLGARSLGGVEDQGMTPARGVTVMVRNEITDGAMRVTSGVEGGGPEEVCFVMMRAAGGGTILGGTAEIGQWAEHADEALVQRIKSRAVEVCPVLGTPEDLDVIGVRIGRRPLRKQGIRLEKEFVVKPGAEGAEGEGGWVVHNYGHAGYGYQTSYGCAKAVAELVGEVRKGL